MSDLALWHAATSPDIDVHRVPWPELAELTDTLRRLRTFGTTPFVARVTGTLWAARRTLTSTPLPPQDATVGLGALAVEIDAFLDAHPAHSAADALSTVRTATGALLTSQNPLGNWVGDVASEYGDRIDHKPEVVLVVPRDRYVTPTKAWLDGEGLDSVDVATAAELRDRCVHNAALILGHPAVTYSSAFTPPQTAAREAGWLLTAPPAHRVRLALLADDPPLTANDVWAWPDPTAHPTWHLNVPARTAATITQTEWFTETPAATATVVRPHGTSDDDVTGTPVVTASGHTIYFSLDTGPVPRFLGLEDTGDVTITRVRIAQLQPGRVLVEYTGGAARDAMNARANQWLTERKHWSPERITAARDGSMAVKWIVLWAELQLARGGLVNELVRTGLGRDYARGMVERVLGGDYIAPRTKGLDALLRIGGRLDWTNPTPPRDWLAIARAARDDLAILRAAHQHAGDMIHRDLRARLGDRAWEDDVTTNGWALIADDTLGDVLLTTVVTVEGPHPVRRSWLGVPKRQEDR